MYMCVGVHVHVLRSGWRPEANTRHPLQSFFTLFQETRLSLLNLQPVSTEDLPVSSSLALGPQLPVYPTFYKCHCTPLFTQDHCTPLSRQGHYTPLSTSTTVPHFLHKATLPHFPHRCQGSKFCSLCLPCISFRKTSMCLRFFLWSLLPSSEAVSIVCSVTNY